MAIRFDKQAYEAEAIRVSEKVERLRKSDSLVFPVFTDVHIHKADEDAAMNLYEAMRALSRQIKADGVLALGDNLAMLGREDHASNEKIKALIRGLLDEIAAIWPCPLFAVNGNHDGVGTDFFKADFWREIIGSGYDQGRAMREENGAWYSVDFEAQKVRMVVLSLPWGSDIEAENPTPLWAFGDDQLRWLAEKALDTSYQVLLVCHVPLYYEYSGDMEKKLGVWNGTQSAESFISALCGWIEDRQEAIDILDAFQRHREYVNERLKIHMKASGEGSGLMACLSGHMHDDSLWQSGEEKDGWKNELPCVQVVTAAANVSINHDLRDRAVFGTSVDVAVLTPSERMLSMIRFGDGKDRSVLW